MILNLLQVIKQKVIKAEPSKHCKLMGALTQLSLCSCLHNPGASSFANVDQQFSTMTHLSSHDNSSANSGHSQPQISVWSARCLAEPQNSPCRHGISAPSIPSTEHRPSQRPVFGNQPTKLWLWYRRESKLSAKYFPSTKSNIFIPKNLLCCSL